MRNLKNKVIDLLNEHVPVKMMDIKGIDSIKSILISAVNEFCGSKKYKISKKNINDDGNNDLNVISNQDNKVNVSLENKEEKNVNIDNNNVNGNKKPIRVYIDGCFDIMHSGHYNAVRQAKKLADVLVVGVHSDEEITRNKGPPVMNDEEREKTVKSCKWVDEVVFGTPYTPSLELLDELNCDFCVHGDDTSTNCDGDDAYSKVRRAGRLRIIKRTEGVSTTDLVGRLLLMTKNHHIKEDDEIQTLQHSSPLHNGMSSITTSEISKIVPEMKLDGDNKKDDDKKSKKIEEEEPKKIEKKIQPKKVEKNPQEDEGHYSKGISSFLPTTWRISQFSSGRTPGKDQKVVYIDGAFDLFHVGHIETLKKAKDLGDFLYVGIHDDASVNKHKGRNYPIMNLHERVLNVLSCKYVDDVVIGAPWLLTKDLISVLGIDVVCGGTNTKLDLDRNEKIDPYQYPKEIGIYKELQTSRTLNTSDVVQRIIENRLKYEKRNASREKKDLDYIKKRQFIAEV